MILIWTIVLISCCFWTSSFKSAVVSSDSTHLTCEMFNRVHAPFSIVFNNTAASTLLSCPRDLQENFLERLITLHPNLNDLKVDGGLVYFLIKKNFSLDLIRLAISRGASVKVYNCMALRLAICTMNLEVAQVLFYNGAKLVDDRAISALRNLVENMDRTNPDTQRWETFLNEILFAAARESPVMIEDHVQQSCSIS